MSDAFPEDLPPLKVRCTDSNCEEDLHCYRATAEMVRDKTAGRCRSCGISLVDWDRVHQRDVSDATFTFEVMKTEFIRHHFWHIEIDAKAIEHARKKGLAAILDHVPKRLMQSIGRQRRSVTAPKPRSPAGRSITPSTRPRPAVASVSRTGTTSPEGGP